MTLVRVNSGNPRNGTQDVKARLAEAERVLADRNAGMPMSEMMTKHGLSRATIFRRIDEAIAARIVPTVDAYREQQNAALDDLMQRWETQVATADAMVETGIREESMTLVERGLTLRQGALQSILRVHERRARLMGVDAPVKVDATVTSTTPVDSAVAALVADIEQQASA